MISAAVVDASVAIKWVVEELHSEQARSLSSSRLEAPDLWPVECANILWKKVQFGDLTAAEARAGLELLLQAPVSISDSRALLPAALNLSFDLKHPVYDCLYLALALHLGIPFVTADRKLVHVARTHKRLAGALRLLSEVEN